MHHGEGFSLGGADGTEGEGDPVDLGFHEAGDIAVQLWARPYLPFGPEGEFAEFLYFWVGVGLGVVEGEASGIEEFYFCAVAFDDAGGFFGEQAAVGAIAQRAV